MSQHLATASLLLFRFDVTTQRIHLHSSVRVVVVFAAVVAQAGPCLFASRRVLPRPQQVRRAPPLPRLSSPGNGTPRDISPSLHRSRPEHDGRLTRVPAAPPGSHLRPFRRRYAHHVVPFPACSILRCMIPRRNDIQIQPRRKLILPMQRLGAQTAFLVAFSRASH